MTPSHTSRAQKPTPPSQRATAIKASRRHIRVLLPSGAEVDARASSRALEVTVGDWVEVSMRGTDMVVDNVLPSKNCLSRSYREETIRIAANLDRLFIVAAASPLFNTTFIDRVITVATLEGIDFTLVVNKSDRELESIRSLISIYERLHLPLLYTSALQGAGFDQLEESLTDESLSIAAFTGISGVGKTSIISRLLPHTTLRVGEVSIRTGQGKQTTTQPEALVYHRAGKHPLLLVDLPGIQNFGVSHLDSSAVAGAFVEFQEVRGQCEFSNCAHRAELHCGVRDAMNRGTIAASRYDSYLRIVEEIEAARPY